MVQKFIVFFIRFFHALDVAINCDRHSLSITLLRLNLVLIVFVARESVDS